MPDARARITVVTVNRLREPLGRLFDLDRGYKEGVTDLDHALGMIGREVDLESRDRLPLRAARQLCHTVSEGIAIEVSRHRDRGHAAETEDRQANGQMTPRFTAHRDPP
jgi:hypothetical protein